MSLLEAIDSFVKENSTDQSYKPVIESLGGVVEAIKKMGGSQPKMSPGQLAAKMAAKSEPAPKPVAKAPDAERADDEQPKTFSDAKSQALERMAA